MQKRLFNMNNHVLVDDIMKHQCLAQKGQVHPITCGNNSTHWLWPKIVNDVVILVCNHCDYIQDNIPAIYRGEEITQEIINDRKHS